MSRSPIFQRFEVNLAYQSINHPNKPWVHWGKVTFVGTTQEEAVRRAKTLQRLFEPEGIKVSMTGWEELGYNIPVE